MKGRLKRNICELDDLIPLSEVKDLATRRKAYIGDALEYACCFWASHLAGVTSSSLEDGKVCSAIDEFFTICFLSWVEVLSLMRNLDAGVHALHNVNKWYHKVSNIYSSKPKISIFTFI
jgi:hypothetical protein